MVRIVRSVVRLLRPRKLVDQGHGPVDAILPVSVLDNVLAGFRILRHARPVHNRPEPFEPCHLPAIFLWDGTSKVAKFTKGSEQLPSYNVCLLSLVTRLLGDNTFLTSTYANHLRMILVVTIQLLPRARALPPSKAKVEVLHLDDAHHASIVSVVSFTRQYSRRRVANVVLILA